MSARKRRSAETPQQESDQFVQPPIFGRFENTREQFHQGVFIITRNHLRAMPRVHQSPQLCNTARC